MGIPWTKEEIEILKNNYTSDNIEKLLPNRKRNSIWAKANKLGLKKFDIKNDILNQEFGKLTVKKYIRKTHKGRGTSVYYRCECNCGKSITVKRASLIRGHSLSCKSCYVPKAWKGGQYISGFEFCKIKRCAKTRNLEFSITINDIEKVYEKQNKKCRFTGKHIYFGSKMKNNYRKLGNASVDRICSNKGYTKSNIQIIEKSINILKMNRTDKEFIQMCCDIADYSREK